MGNVIDLAFFSSTLFTLIVIMDPPGNMPIFLGLTSRMTAKERARAALQATMVSFGVLTVFGLFGSAILGALHISVEAMQFSGGLLLLLVALQLLTGEEADPGKAGGSVNVAIVPLGMPLLAGPGTIVAIMISAEDASGSTPKIVAAIAAALAAHLIAWLSMRFSALFVRILGQGGITLLTKLAGMLLAAIATQLMVNAILSIIETI